MGNRLIEGGFVPFYWEQIDCGRLALFMVRFKYYMKFMDLSNYHLGDIQLRVACSKLKLLLEEATLDRIVNNYN